MVDFLRAVFSDLTVFSRHSDTLFPTWAHMRTTWVSIYLAVFCIWTWNSPFNQNKIRKPGKIHLITSNDSSQTMFWVSLNLFQSRLSCSEEAWHGNWLTYSFEKLFIKHLLCANSTCRCWLYSNKQNQVLATFNRGRGHYTSKYIIQFQVLTCVLEKMKQGKDTEWPGGICTKIQRGTENTELVRERYRSRDAILPISMLTYKTQLCPKIKS